MWRHFGDEAFERSDFVAVTVATQSLGNHF
jgi:hypothetical protein